MRSPQTGHRPRAGRRKSLVTAIIGGGRVGSVLGKLLANAGHPPACIVSRTIDSARKAGRFAGSGRFSTSLETIPDNTNFIIVATPHESVNTVAENLARLGHLDFAGLKACHTSGMMTAAALEPLARKGATIFSFHPLQTFPRDFAPREIVESVRGIYYGIDGPPEGLRAAHHLAALLGGKTVEIPPDLRILYHASCVVASNHLTVLLWLLGRMYERIAGRGEDFYPVFRPIIDATLRNIGRTSPARALSGPVARGGVDTVAGHLEAVGEHVPEILPYFLRMTEETTRLAEEKGSLTHGQAEALYRLVHSHTLQLHDTGRNS